MHKVGIIIFISLLLTGIYIAAFATKPRPMKAEIVRDAEAIGEQVIVWVISDTHIPSRASELPKEVFEIFKGVERIIHAGDFVSAKVLGELEKIAPVTAVHGNMDSAELREKLPRINSVEVLGWRIGVVHNGIPLLRSGAMRELARKNGFDVLIFGHTHRGFVKQEGGVLYVNPGSPTQPLLAEPSVAILKVSRKKVEAEIVVIKR